MADFSAYIAGQKERFLQELEEFLRIPSVSTTPERAADVRRCAEWLRDAMLAAGIGEVEVIPTDRHPIVYAEHVTDPDAPTILVYGHYDVQPSEPDELWTTPPFEPATRDGRMYARGTIDDKGQVHMHVKALETRLATGAGIPVNVKLVIEGEEEVGSHNLESFLRDGADRLACDAVVISDTAMFGHDIPCITIGLRGIVYMEVTVRGPGHDLHSGSYGGAVVNPANALGAMIARLHDENGRVTLPGFYESVRPIGDREKEDLARLPFDEAELLESVGAPELGGEAGFGTLERLWFRPTLDVNGLLSGFTGEGAKTVLPSSAMAKISMRLVPDQDPDAVARSFKEAVSASAPPGVTVEVRRFHGGSPWVAEVQSPVFEAADAALESAFGRRPVFIREGGSIPIVPLFEEILDAPVVLLGFALPGSNPHAPDEWLDLSVYEKGIGALADLYDEIAARGV